MANTYYDSQLTAEEIEEILEAINGILTPANNGKVLAISNGKLKARSVQWGGGGAVVQPLSVTQNGDYYPETGVDGFDEVHVNVPSSQPTLQSKTVTPGASQQTVTPDSGYDGLSSVVVNGDADLVAGNIKKDVEIFGVTGSYEGGVAPPTGVITITHNSVVDVTDYATANVNVPGGTGAALSGTDDPTSQIGSNGDVYIQYLADGYLESSGGNQWIDTGYKIKPESVVEVSFYADADYVATNGSFIFGERASGARLEFVADKNNGRVIVNGSSTHVVNIPILGHWNYARIEPTNIIVINDDGDMYQVYTNQRSNTAVANMGLFTLTGYGKQTAAKMKLRYFKITENGVVMLHLIPATYQGVPCVKDVVSGGYIFNSGTGVFTNGPAGEIYDTWLKVNGVWQKLVGSNIADVG